MSKHTDLHQRMTAAVGRRFPSNGIAHDHFGALLSDYAESGIGPSNLVIEIKTGDEHKLWSFAWEAMLYRHLRAQGYDPKKGGTAKRGGPDFRIEHGGRTIWVEAVVPSPEGIPAEYLELRPGEAKSKLDTAPLLRCTSVIRDKRDKFDRYREQGIIGAADATVIALNICRLSDLDADGNGLSQWPLAMEAVLPVGALTVTLDSDGRIAGTAQNAPRLGVRKPNGEEVQTTAFLDVAFAGVSAVLQAHQREMHRHGLALTTIHNRLATNPLPKGLLGVYKEFVVEPDGEGYRIRDVRFEARLRQLRDSMERRFGAREDRIVRSVTAVEAGDFAGEPHRCHENVNRWCFIRDHFRHLRVPGWLISGDCVLDKHSVIDIGDGELIDVTPMRDDARRTFLLHDGTEDEFRAMPNQIILAR